MFANKSSSRMFSVVLVIVFMLALVGPAHAAPALFVEPAKAAEAPSLLQSKSNSTPAGTQASPAVCPPSIGFGEIIQCSIVSANEIDTYTFTASAGDKVLVRMSHASGSFWPGVRVYASDGTKLCEQRSSDSQTAEIASCSLPSTGTYTIQAYDGLYGVLTGDYYLYLQRLNNPSSPVSITFGQTLSGSIVTPAEMDTYTFMASAGDKVLVRMSKTTQWNLWPGVRVYGPDGAKLCEQRSSDSAKAEIASCLLPSTGTYIILAYDSLYGTGTADYYLYLQRLNNPGSFVSITFGQTLPGSIPTPAEMDTYTFAASAGDKVLVRMSKTSQWNLWPGVRVYGPDGAKLCEQDSSDSAKTEIASCLLPSTGTYTILAYDSQYGTGTADYYIYLQRLNNPGGPVSITFGQTLSASIITPAEMDTYTFTANANDKVLVRMSQSSGSLWPGVRVYGPDGTKLCEQHSPDAQIAEIASCSLPSTGTYIILAYDSLYGTYTGGYSLYLQQSDSTGSSVSISGNAGIAGAALNYTDGTSMTVTADGSGNYSFTVPSNWSGTVTPSLAGYAFTPASRSYTNITVDQTGQDYIADIAIFGDVPPTYWASSFIERLYNAGITGGCSTSPLMYCPEATVTRAQMAIFILRGIHGSAYIPPAATGTVFTDVPLGSFAADWIEQLAFEGVTAGCGGGNYCPDATITRAQMAIFLLRGEHGSTYTPPTATGAVFGDVPPGSFAADWIEQLALEGITSGCGGGNYCPDANMTRAEMAVFLVRAFSLP